MSSSWAVAAGSPWCSSFVKNYFDGKEPVNVDGINPDEAVAYGAAVQGSYLAGHHDDDDKVFWGTVTCSASLTLTRFL